MRLLVVMVVVVGPIRYVCNGSGGGRWFGHIADVISTVRCVRDLIMVCAIIATMDGGSSSLAGRARFVSACVRVVVVVVVAR